MASVGVVQSARNRAIPREPRDPRQFVAEASRRDRGRPYRRKWLSHSTSAGWSTVTRVRSFTTGSISYVYNGFGLVANLEQVEAACEFHAFTGRRFSEILGPAEARYFGGGFRRVGHLIRVPLVTQEDAELRLQGVGFAMYPDDWSLDAAGQPRPVHLSSFDAIALTAALLRAGVSQSSQVEGLLQRPVRGVRVKAPAQVVASTQGIKIEARCSRTPADTDDARVTSRVGRFTIELDLGTGASPLGPVDCQVHHADHRAPLLPGRVIHATETSVHATHEFVTAPSPLTCLDELAMFGQLSQITVYSAKQADRARVPNLWLRRLSLSRSDAVPTGPIESHATIIRDRVLHINGEPIVDLQLIAATNYGAQAEASFAYSAPS